MFDINHLSSHFSNEQMYVIICCRLLLGTCEKDEALQFINSRRFDYTRIGLIAGTHQVRPAMYTAIEKFKLPAERDYHERIKRFATNNQVRSLEQARICSAVQQMFTAAGVDSFAYKGVAFAVQFYPDISLRESTDVDLMVSEDAVNKVKAVFESAGFKSKLSVPDHYLDYYTKHFKELVYTAPTAGGDGCSVETHWKLLNYYFGDYPSFSFFNAHPQVLEVGPFAIKTVTADYHLLAVMSNHFVKDMALKLKYLLDVAMLLRKNPQINVSLLAEVMDAYHCRKRIEAGLFLTGAILGVEVKAFRFRYRFHEKNLSAALQAPLPFVETLVTKPAFLRAAWQLQDNSIEKIKFINRCIRYQLLPTDNDLHSSRKKLPVWLLAIIRPFRQMGVLFRGGK